MTSRLFTLLSALSLLLLVASFILWLRGFWLNDTFSLSHTVLDAKTVRSRIVYLDSDNCRFAITYRVQRDALHDYQLPAAQRLPSFNFSHGANPTSPFRLLFGNPGEPWWNRLGFEHYTSDDIIEPRTNTFDTIFAAPFWSVLLLFSLLPAFKLLLFTRHRRLANGLCPTCAYDLRASKHLCPECGTPIPNDATKVRSC